MSAAAQDAYRTLCRGSRFLTAGRTAAPPRVIGNALRELDRFLEIVVIELAAAQALPPPAGRRDTANRLRGLRAGLRLDDPDQPRLRALARSRACLFFCAGVVRRGDVRGSATMTSGWYGRGGTALRTVAVGDTLHVSPDDVLDACRYYERLGDRLMRDTLTL